MQHPKIRAVTGDLTTNAQLTVGPLKKGFGQTVGFALRRALLSLTTGVSVTKIAVEGAHHKLSPVYGIVEGMTQLIANVRQVIFLTPEDTTTVSISKDMPGTIYARDIRLPPDSRILNPNLVIGHLTAGRINVWMRAQRGWGYVTKASEVQPSNAVTLDSTFSSVLKVTYSVVLAGLEGTKTSENLVLGIQTDGSVSPIEALKQAVVNLKAQLSFAGGHNNET